MGILVDDSGRVSLTDPSYRLNGGSGETLRELRQRTTSLLGSLSTPTLHIG